MIIIMSFVIYLAIMNIKQSCILARIGSCKCLRQMASGLLSLSMKLAVLYDWDILRDLLLFQLLLNTPIDLSVGRIIDHSIIGELVTPSSRPLNNSLTETKDYVLFAFILISSAKIWIVPLLSLAFTPAVLKSLTIWSLLSITWLAQKPAAYLLEAEVWLQWNFLTISQRMTMIVTALSTSFCTMSLKMLQHLVSFVHQGKVPSLMRSTIFSICEEFSRLSDILFSYSVPSMWHFPIPYCLQAMRFFHSSNETKLSMKFLMKNVAGLVVRSYLPVVHLLNIMKTFYGRCEPELVHILLSRTFNFPLEKLPLMTSMIADATRRLYTVTVNPFCLTAMTEPLLYYSAVSISGDVMSVTSGMISTIMPAFLIVAAASLVAVWVKMIIYKARH